MPRLSENPPPGVPGGGGHVTVMVKKKLKVDHFFIFVPEFFSIK